MGVEGLQLIVKSLLVSVGVNGKPIGDESKVESKREIMFGEDGTDNVEEIGPTQGEGETPIANVVETFDKKLKIQEEIENGILKFNMHPMKGLKYLCSAGHLQMEAKSVAEFLHSFQDKLDKTMIGELLGREREYENGFAYAVLNEYVELMDFGDLKFDRAIRYFLHGFRLPGEAQKIDRIMEKFAERYYLQHKDEFASADMAFILAFSTIMLQTNLHNPAIRDDKRMTKDQFIKQNKGISTDGELSDELLMEIYDRIAAEPIAINQESKKMKKEEPSSSFVVFQSANDKRKKDAFNNERLEMVRAGEAMIRQGKKRGSVFVRSNISEDSYVKPMFEIVWPSIIGVVSQILETTDEPKLVELSLSCLQSSIALSCRLDHAVARKTMLHVLSKFTTLDTVREMKQKNIQCIKLLLEIALAEGENLEDSWNLVLQHISQLARLQLFASGGQTDDIFFSDSNNGKKSLRFNFQDRISSPQSDPLTKLFMGPSKAEVNRLVEESNAELLSREIDPLLIDRIFLGSTNLSATSVMHFVRGLCEVSMSEISTSSSMNSLKGRESSFDISSPRIFSLQKLVEVADYNMTSRSRVDWSNIWKYLADHFTNVGLQDNSALAMYAIDSLKQLSIKFLQKSELSNFNFQRIFLKPFEVIISRSGSTETKDLVLRCIDIMIRACAANIRSGWKSIFNILEVAASQQSHDIAKFGFDILEGLLNNHFTLLLNDFVELMNALVVYVSAGHTELSLKALNDLSRCAELLAQGSVVPVSVGLNDGTNGVKYKIEEDAAVFRLWWPLLLGLSTHVADFRVPVRCQALDTLSHILNKFGDIFSGQTWSVIFKGVLFPMIDSAKLDSNNIAFKHSWIGTMAKSVLNTCLELYLRFHSNDSDAPLLPALLTMLQGCICQENETLARMALDALKKLVLSNRSSFVGPQLDLLIDRFQRILSSLLVFEYFDAGRVYFDSVKCIHLLRSLLFMRNHTTADSGVASGLLYDMKNVQDNIVKTTFGDGILEEVMIVMLFQC
jgi:brefeldin A-inhibited guanine nucleotide-exchange protein